uniref:Uncharacterized protein n=1 Tax=Arundo donax TaxID=35708 RepID=A0A0A9D6M3_ARUDO
MIIMRLAPSTKNPSLMVVVVRERPPSPPLRRLRPRRIILRVYGVVVHLRPEAQQYHFVGLLDLWLDLDVARILERCHDENFYSILHQNVVLH